MNDVSGFGAALAVYLIGTASPGPGNLAIADAALNHGRARGIALAAGVISGSLCWAVMAAAGVSALLVAVPGRLATLKLAGAGYLLWLAWRTCGTAWGPPPASAEAAARMDGGGARFYLRGLGIHLTNPKAVLNWLAVTTIGLGAAAAPWRTFALVASCCALGFGIFMGYALLFSSRRAAPALARARRPFGVACACVYGALAAGILLSLT
ncbi:LysE family translocator [Burkholderia sp. FERM BP-3421]|uniref:LysE family translocator n=1 Tax=Burkholderia sp. FERM BP-3421 TaxID=1494466 RepID=UPI002361102C|nr:LysE family translocator [Burkholderia sp. FERM BP-3421]WDD91092.1 LysE family translocator [Burkholderia sp. FERM BP-3421]